MLTATYLCNRIPLLVLQIENLHKVLYGWDADLSKLNIMGAGNETQHVVESRSTELVEARGRLCGMIDFSCFSKVSCRE